MRADNVKVYAVYIITTDGRPMLSQIFQSPADIPENTLLAALLTSLQIVTKDLMKEENTAEKFTMKGNTYHFKSFGKFFVVLVTDEETTPHMIINRIGWQFLKEFDNQINNWMGKQDDFSDFKPRLCTIISKVARIDESRSLKPAKILDPIQLYKLEKELKNTAKSLLFFKEATIHEICENIGEDELLVKENIDKLVKLGFIGYYKKNKVKYYFC